MRVISGKARGTILDSLQENTTRPTLDRVKEALFNILQPIIRDAIVLDLFAGSGALGIESLSRDAKKAVFCDQSRVAIDIIKRNIDKTHLQEYAQIIQGDYQKVLRHLKGQEKFDIVFVDPPYDKDMATKSVSLILEYELLAQEGMIVIETDEEKRVLQELEKLPVEVYDLRKYGRVKLIFLNRKG